MNVYDKLNKLLEKKEQEKISEDEKKSLEVIKSMLSNRQLFFICDIDTVLGILDYLGVKEDELNSYYFELISPENYQQSFPKERIGVKLK